MERLGIQAKRSGKEWYAKCPNQNHQDKSPSWRIRDEPGSAKHGFHNCYPCGYSGSLVGLVADLLGVHKGQAREWLGGEQVELGEPSYPSARVTVVSGKKDFEIPPGVTFKDFDLWVTPAREYVQKRGILREQVERWGIGYAVDGELGGRIVFPYRDALGVPKGYTARTYLDVKPRYKEPHPTEKPDRSVVFGEQHWCGEDRVFVAEGAINALAIERARDGVNVVAMAGSEIGPWVWKLARFSEVFVLTDPDEAGDKAASVLCGALARHTMTTRIHLPRGKDAADLGEGLKEFLP